MSNFDFPSSMRLKQSEEFDHVFAQKCSVSDKHLVLYVAQNGKPTSRLGLVVSKKVGNAVVRNRWKRLIREAFRLTRTDLPDNLDLVVIPRRDVTPELLSLKNSLVTLSRRAHRRLLRSFQPTGK